MQATHFFAHLERIGTCQRFAEHGIHSRPHRWRDCNVELCGRQLDHDGILEWVERFMGHEGTPFSGRHDAHRKGRMPGQQGRLPFVGGLEIIVSFPREQNGHSLLILISPGL
jgi:hypothetical protein